MFSQKSVLARLLANENITVQQGNYETAYFDVQSRVLGLPLWKEMSKDVYDMLVGHEVSHALFTPTNFFEYPGSKGLPHSWINIVEDIRIEKLILRKYPGLVGNFKRGYHEMMMGPSDLFGIRRVNIATMGFMDRLNIRAKARDMIEVPFADDEKPYVAKAMAVETYEDVIRVCQEIREWLKEKAEEAKANGMPDMVAEEDASENGITIGIITDESENAEVDPNAETVTPDIIVDARTEKSEPKEEKSEDDASEGKGEETEEAADKDGESDEEAKGEAEKSTPAEEPKSGDADQEVQTEVAYRENQKGLVDNSTTYVRGLTRQESMGRILPYSVVAEARRKTIERIKQNSWNGQSGKFPEADFAEFIRESKLVVNLMVKEFEMRKAAFRTLRARQSTKGSLDVNKLHKYQYDDMLFKQVSHLADAKNHGMVMLIDYSGSMYQMLPNVIKQTLTLLMFCKRVGIPFEVYSFTSTGSIWDPYVKKVTDNTITRVSADGLGLIKLFSTDMSKRDYEESFRMMFWQSQNTSYRSGFEDLGNTPLNTALMAMQYVIEDFRAKYRVQKMNFISLTDGDSNTINVKNGFDLPTDTYGSAKRRGSGYTINVNGKLIKVDGFSQYGSRGREVTAALVKAIRDMDVVCVNYFVCSSGGDVNGEIGRSLNVSRDTEAFKSARRKLTTDGVLVLDNNYGYSRRFILDGRGSAMSGSIEDLDFDEDASVAKIAKAFSKSNGSKKKSKIVTQKFAEMVA